MQEEQHGRIRESSLSRSATAREHLQRHPRSEVLKRQKATVVQTQTFIITRERHYDT